MIQIRRLLAILLLVLAIGLATNAYNGNTYISSTGERVKANLIENSINN